MDYEKLKGIVDFNAIAVDAGCSGNPGPMEYQGVYLGNEQRLFHFGPIQGTNNIGEFLAIVHALALIKQNNWNMKVYSDSVSGMAWVRNRKAKTTLVRNEQTAQALDLVARAEKWLRQNPLHAEVRKWNTEEWGEIHADFGRKK
jgi:ribonuclease HI